MSVFLIADIEVTNDGWVPEYAANVHNLVENTCRAAGWINLTTPRLSGGVAFTQVY